jgi:XTP/dITP diphosphohydrolase
LQPLNKILIATSNPGKLRDFAGIAAPLHLEILSLPNFPLLPAVIEDGSTFEENARKKAKEYGAYAPGELVLADDSGLEVDALNGAPGVHSARYAAEDLPQTGANADDEANNAKLIRELNGMPPEKRTARFVCIIAAARDRRILATFRGMVEGTIQAVPRGSYGFGYDPLFYLPAIDKTLAELTPVEKVAYSHRGAAFRKFIAWYELEKAASTL